MDASKYREAPNYACHLFTSLVGKCRDPTKCPKNHVFLYEDRHGPKANLEIRHHKYAKLKGPQTIPLSQGLFSLFGMLGQANKALFTKVGICDMCMDLRLLP